MMTIAEYARWRSCDHKTVRQAVAEGRIAGALAPDGRIADPELADRLWAENTSRGNRAAGGPQPTVSLARRRATIARIATLEAEVGALRRSAVTPAAAAQVIAEEVVAPMVALLRALPAQCTGPAEAEAAVDALLSALAQPVPSPPAPAPPPRTDGLAAHQLEARRLGLMAEKVELSNALAAGELVHTTSFEASLAEGLADIRAALLALPDRVAAGADPGQEVAAIIADAERLVPEDAAPHDGPAPPAGSALSERARGQWADPEVRAKMVAGLRAAAERRRAARSTP